MGAYKTEAIVLRARNYGEADKVLTVFTRGLGKIQAIAKGVRKPQSRLRGGIQPFTLSLMALNTGRTWDIITQTEPRAVWVGAQASLERLVLASYLAELIEALLPEREGNDQVFDLACRAFAGLSAPDPELIVRAVEMKLMNLMGYKPILDRCAQDGKPLGGDHLVFSARLGGALCRECAGTEPDGIRVSRASLPLLASLERMDLAHVQRLKVSPPLRKEIEDTLRYYLTYHLERHLKSAAFLHVLR
jgi:DNA repair protein RecO (recombination protein O)